LPSGKGRFQLGQFMPKALFLAMEAMSTESIVSIRFASTRKSQTNGFCVGRSCLGPRNREGCLTQSGCVQVLAKVDKQTDRRCVLTINPGVCSIARDFKFPRNVAGHLEVGTSAKRGVANSSESCSK
jgi:hypothetical protein